MGFKKPVIPVLIALAGVLSAPLARAEEHVTFDEANAPFMYLKDGAPAGLYPVLFAEVFKRMNAPVKMEAIPWKRAISCIDAAECGVGGIYQNSARIVKYDYSKPFFEEKLMVYVAASKSFTFSGLSDLTGKTVGVIRGWSYGDDFDRAVADKKINKDEMVSDEANIQKLEAGRVDAVICIAESGAAVLKKLNLGDKIKVLPTPLAINKVYLAFNKKANKLPVLAAFDKAIDSMRADRSLQAIISKSLGQ